MGNTIPAPVWVVCNLKNIQVLESDGMLKIVLIMFVYIILDMMNAL